MIIKYNSVESFETKRLFARKHTTGDFDTVLSTYQDELTMQTLGGVVTKEEAAQRIQWNLDCWARDGFDGWLWYHKESGRFMLKEEQTLYCPHHFSSIPPHCLSKTPSLAYLLFLRLDDNGRSMIAIRSEYTMITSQVHPQGRH